MHTLIRTVGTGTYLSLDIARQFYASLHILTLYKLEDDVTLRRSRVETLIGLLIALLHRDNGVLSHSHIEIILGTVHTERISFKTAGYLTGWQRIGMYRDKQVGIGAVSNVGTLFQRNKNIRLAGIDDSHIRHIALNIFAKLQCHREIDILFFGNSTKCTRIMTAMTWVDNERETAVGACRCQHQHTQ